MAATSRSVMPSCAHTSVFNNRLSAKTGGSTASSVRQPGGFSGQGTVVPGR